MHPSYFAKTKLRVLPWLHNLIHNRADQDHRAHHGKIQRTGNIHQVDQIAQHLQQRGSENDSNNRAFPTAEAAASDDRCGNPIKLIKVSVR